MSDSYMEIENAVGYFVDAVKESNEIINDCSPDLQKELMEQQGHFIAALAALREKAQKPCMVEEIKRNCNSCKFSILRICEALKNNEEYQKLVDEKDTLERWVTRHKFKDNFICDNYKCRYIEYPIEVSMINLNKEMYCLEKDCIGKFASIRPCSDEYKGKTYLGLFLGDLPMGHHITHNPETKELSVSFHCNPAIFVFDLKKIVYGCESWWGIIKSEKELQQITDQDIDNAWYVKALKQLSHGESEPND